MCQSLLLPRSIHFCHLEPLACQNLNSLSHGRCLPREVDPDLHPNTWSAQISQAAIEWDGPSLQVEWAWIIMITWLESFHCCQFLDLKFSKSKARVILQVFISKSNKCTKSPPYKKVAFGTGRKLAACRSCGLRAVLEHKRAISTAAVEAATNTSPEPLAICWCGWISGCKI